MRPQRPDSRIPLVLATLALLAGPALAQTPGTGAAGGSPPLLDPVGTALPQLAGVSPAEQARTLAWMLTVNDERRLVPLFPDLHARRAVPLGERGLDARGRAEELLRGLERRGVPVDWPPGWLTVAETEPAAPPPNFVPPEIQEELERAAAGGRSPGAAESLEEVRRIRFEAALERRARGGGTP